MEDCLSCEGLYTGAGEESEESSPEEERVMNWLLSPFPSPCATGADKVDKLRVKLKKTQEEGSDGGKVF